MRLQHLRLIAVLVLATCQPFEPPAGAARWDPPPTFAGWWADVESCSQLRGDLARVTWFLVPGDAFEAEGQEVAGRWEPPHRIYLAADWAETPFVVKHEMLHELRGAPGHPGTPFHTPCHLAPGDWWAP